MLELNKPTPLLQRLMRTCAWIGLAVFAAGVLVVLVQWALGCSLIDGCATGLPVKMSARLMILGLLLGFIGNLDR